MKKIIIATNNSHKLTEFRRMLEPLGFEVNSMGESGIVSCPVEDGETFSENAFIKAEDIADKVSGVYVLADDSGLAVEHLGGAPGVYSARYAGESATATDNNNKLLRALDGVTDRRAKFVCNIALICPGGERAEFLGECVGEIDSAPHGDGGFGYDPIFLYDGVSFAVMSDEEKDKVSHRGKALEKLLRFLSNE